MELDTISPGPMLWLTGRCQGPYDNETSVSQSKSLVTSSWRLQALLRIPVTPWNHTHANLLCSSEKRHELRNNSACLTFKQLCLLHSPGTLNDVPALGRHRSVTSGILLPNGALSSLPVAL